MILRFVHFSNQPVIMRGGEPLLSLFAKSRLNSQQALIIVAIGIVMLCVLMLMPAPGRPLWAVLLLLIVPAFLWAAACGDTGATGSLASGLIGFGLVYVVNSLAVLCIHYIPGPISRPLVIGVITLLAGVPLMLLGRRRHWTKSTLSWNWQLGVILLIALLFRVVKILYNEIGGDEALILLQSAQAIGGQDDVLFWHKKGPVELLIPIITWLAHGTMNEAVARLPFVFLSVGAVLAMYELSRVSSGKWAALLATALAAVNGYFIAYGRIAQYQSAILFMLPMAFLSLRRGGRAGTFLSGLFMGFALLAHYDATMALPAFYYALLTLGSPPGSRSRLPWGSIVVATVGVLLVTVPFYLPFLLSPGREFAYQYLTGARLATLWRGDGDGDLPRHCVDAVYNSSYYLVGLSAMLLAALLADLSHWRRRVCLALLLVLLPAGFTAAAVPELWEVAEINWALVPFGLLFSFCILAPGVPRHRRILWLWLATSFLFYFFAVGDPRTHFYNVFLPWILLASEALIRAWTVVSRALPRFVSRVLQVACVAVFVLVAGFPYIAFIRTDRDYVAGYPESRTPIYWSFADTVPENVYFGFPHRVGWKAIGELYADKASVGLYNSNEIPRITGWYTRRGLRTQCASPDYYFVDRLHPADRLDSVSIDNGYVDAEYGLVEVVTVADEPRLAVYQRGIEVASPLMYRAEDFGSLFDQQATPDSWFVELPRYNVESTHVEFGEGIRLVGYVLETRSVPAGESLSLVLYWRTTQLVEENYVVFVHLIKDGVVQLGGGDGLPDCGAQPTPLWVPGEIVLDYHEIETFPDADCTECGLFIGMYDLHTGERLAVVMDGQRMAGDTLYLTSVAIAQ